MPQVNAVKNTHREQRVFVRPVLRQLFLYQQRLSSTAHMAHIR